MPTRFPSTSRATRPWATSSWGAPVPVKFSDIKNDALIFGDPDNYSFKLTRTGDGAAIGRYHGRRGYSKALLRRTPM